MKKWSSSWYLISDGGSFNVATSNVSNCIWISTLSRSRQWTSWTRVTELWVVIFLRSVCPNTVLSLADKVFHTIKLSFALSWDVESLAKRAENFLSRPLSSWSMRWVNAIRLPIFKSLQFNSGSGIFNCAISANVHFRL